jgi:hypothetical protein
MPDLGINEQAMRSGQAGLNSGLSLFASAQKDIDEGIVKDRAGLLADGYRGVLQDPEKGGGYLNQKGYNAVNGRTGALQSMSSLRKSLEATLETTRQRDAFAQVANAATSQAESHIDQHYNREALVFNLSRTSSLATARQNDWVSTGSEESKGAMVGQITEASRMLGDPEATRAEKILDALSKGHAARIMAALTTDSIGAAKMFNAAREAKELDPNTEQQLQQRISIKDTADFSQRLANALTTPKKVEPTKLSSFSDNFHLQDKLQLEADDNAVVEVERRFNLPDNDPAHINLEVRDATLKRIEAGAKQRLEGHQKQAEAALNEGTRWLNEHPNDSFEFLKSDNPELWQRGLAYDMTDNWATYAEKRNFTDDPRKEAEFRDTSPSELEGLNYATWRLENVSNFTPSTLNLLSERILEAQGREPSSVAAAGQKLVDDAINQSMYAVGIANIDPTADDIPGLRNTQDNILLRQQAQRRVNTYRANARRLIAQDLRLPSGQRIGYAEVLKRMETAPLTRGGVNLWALSPLDKKDAENAAVVTNATNNNEIVSLEKLNITDEKLQAAQAELKGKNRNFTVQDAVNVIMLGRQANENQLVNDAVSYVQKNMPNEVLTESKTTFFSLLAVATVTGLPESTIVAQLGDGDRPPRYGTDVIIPRKGYTKETFKKLLIDQVAKEQGAPLEKPSTKFDTPEALNARQDEVLTNRFNTRLRNVPVVEVAAQDSDGKAIKVRSVSMSSIAKMSLADQLRSINTGSDKVDVKDLQNSLTDQLQDRGVFGEFQGGLTLAAVAAETGLSEKEVVAKVGRPQVPYVGPAFGPDRGVYSVAQLQSLDEQTSKVANLSRDELVPVEEVLAAFLYLAKNPKPAAGQPWTRAPGIANRRPVWQAPPNKGEDKPHRNSVKPKMGGF